MVQGRKFFSEGCLLLYNVEKKQNKRIEGCVKEALVIQGSRRKK